MEHKQFSYALTLDALDETGHFSGYASVFHVEDLHHDVILPGAYRDTITAHLQESIPLLWQHKPEEPIGVIQHLREDDHGLYVEGRLLLEVQRAKEAYALLKSGALNGLSIGFTVDNYDIDETTGVRRIYAITLYEISLVTFPANPAAQVTGLKAEGEHGHADVPNTIREFEHFLRDAGFSRKAAKAIANHGFGAIIPEETPCDAVLTIEDALEIDSALDTALCILR